VVVGAKGSTLAEPGKAVVVGANGSVGAEPGKPEKGAVEAVEGALGANGSD